MKKYKELPHIDMIGLYQFVTFRTKDSIDDFVIKLQSQAKYVSTKELKIDEYLDLSEKGCYFYDKDLEEMYLFLLGKNKVIYDLIAFVIMPNHEHLLFKQTIPLAKTMQSLKGGSSHLLKSYLSESLTSVWSRNYFDKAIRDNKHFMLTYEYIKNNAKKAGLKDCVNRFYGIYE